jgi:hypothetical protein
VGKPLTPSAAGGAPSLLIEGESPAYSGAKGSSCLRTLPTAGTVVVQA